MSNELRIAVSEEKGSTPVTIMYVSGDLDSKTYPDLEAKASDVIAGGAKNILLDLHEVHFMGSAGLRAMHAMSVKLKDTGGQLKLLNPSDPGGARVEDPGIRQVLRHPCDAGCGTEELLIALRCTAPRRCNE